MPVGLVSTLPGRCSGGTSVSPSPSTEVSLVPSVATWPGPVWPIRSLLMPMPAPSSLRVGGLDARMSRTTPEGS